MSPKFEMPPSPEGKPLQPHEAMSKAAGFFHPYDDEEVKVTEPKPNFSKITDQQLASLFEADKTPKRPASAKKTRRLMKA